jgi:hypothetical protein
MRQAVAAGTDISSWPHAAPILIAVRHCAAQTRSDRSSSTKPTIGEPAGSLALRSVRKNCGDDHVCRPAFPGIGGSLAQPDAYVAEVYMKKLDI